MKFKLHKSSDWEYEKEVEVNTLDDLKKLQEDCDKELKEAHKGKTHRWEKCELIVDFCNMEIELYDYYRE